MLVHHEKNSCTNMVSIIVVQYELYELYDWGKVPELYSGHGTLWNFYEF